MKIKIDDTNSMQELIERLKTVKEVGTFETCNCDIYGWRSIDHLRMREIHSEGLEGFRVSYSVRYEVTDWTIYKKEK